MPEGTELIQITRDGMVLVVTLNNLPEPFTYLRWPFMLPADQFCFYRSQLRHHPLAGRFAPYDEAPVAPTLPRGPRSVPALRSTAGAYHTPHGRQAAGTVVERDIADRGGEVE
jgi:hypothetical protein